MPDRTIGGWFKGGFNPSNGNSETLDVLPADESPEIIDGAYIKYAQFKASIRGFAITVGGAVILRLEVPYEWKYESMPLSDVRGIEFMVTCHKPLTRQELEAMGQPIPEPSPLRFEDWLNDD